ncbi:putative late blight resistance protein homolog R1A-3 [Coffea arabica]|uniref:Late blight resistance protein homolog R1A-3 n=1 Tax=Coffea arabica TaxID=13443 RepID=A0A6P6V9R4_COFAR|nr:putative late blight resistance protein homolog R1A-3 [Coffea arabica]
MMDNIRNLQMELRFLKMFSLCLKKREEPGKDMHVGSIMIGIETLQKEAEGSLHDACLAEIPESKIEDWGPLASNLLEKIQNFKREIIEISALLLDCSLQSKSCKAEEILELIDSILWNLKALVNLEGDVLGHLKDQIRAIQEQLSFLGNFVGFTAKRCVDLDTFEDFLVYMGDWVNKAACLLIVYWLQGKDEYISSRLEMMLSDLLQKVTPCLPKVTEMYVAVLKASKSSRSSKFLAGQVVTSFVELILQDLTVLMKDSVDVLKEGLVFLITFLIDPPEECARDVGNIFLAQIDAIITDSMSLICSVYIDESKENFFTERRTFLSRFESKIKKIEADAKEIYVQLQVLSQINFPSTNGMGFIDSLLGNLEEMLKHGANCPPFAKHKVLKIQGELLSLRPLLKDVMELQNEHEDLKDLWKRIINVSYKAEHAINSCLIIQKPIWYNMISLADVVEEIKLIRIDLEKINVDKMLKPRMPGADMNLNQLNPGQLNTSRLQDVVVGFKDEAETIINRLTRGSAQLDIVSIVGMPGLGKTTLAKKVYNDPAVKYYFNRCAWCCISQVYRVRELLLDILSDITVSNVRLSSSNTSDEDLVEQLWRSLKRQRYLIVMDDIWEIQAWECLKRSLPDDRNGSRIIFTSRIHNLALQAKPDCSPHTLRPLSGEESWELLEQKLFDKAGCPTDLVEIGKRIATNCKGLALAVVLVAGILTGKSRNLDWWLQVESSIGSHIVAADGCMDVLQLSYKHLPDCLRPCFLYFAAYPEDTVVGVQKLMRLWIAQGFIQRIEGKSLDDVAEEYLMDLISRSLVIVAKRSSKGRIKTCRVHDLVHELCLVKVKEENFLHWVHERDVSQNLDPREYDQYRLCIDSEWTHFTKSSSQGPLVNSLQLFGTYEMSQPHSSPSSFFNNFRLLQVLDLECLYLEPSFPEEITLITPLRYLALWCSIRHVPSSIGNLWNLETFIVKSAQLDVPLPDSFWRLKHLRHAAVGDLNHTSFIDSEQGESCQLDNIVTFSKPTLAFGKDSEELMRRLPRLQKLNCVFFEPQYDHLKPILFPKLSSLSNLESLKVYSYGMVFYGEKRDQFPTFDFPNTLRKLTLGRFSVPWSAISVIGQLPNLEILKLRRNSFSGPRWDVEDGEFQKLKFLELWQLNIEEWNVSSEPFPRLEQLTIRDCYSLQEIPSSIGDIPTLEKLEVHWCFDAASSAKQILEEQRDMGNDLLEVIIRT